MEDAELRLASQCRHSTWEVLRGGSPRYKQGHTSEPCVWIRQNGRFLAVLDGRPSMIPQNALNASEVKSCWSIGYQQSWSQEHWRSVWPEKLSVGAPVLHHSQRTLLWLMVSENYRYAFDRLLRSLEAAGDPVQVCARWSPDMKITTLAGFTLNSDHPTNRHIFWFNYRKYLVLFEALLFSLSMPARASPMVVIMDLDVQVFPGWTHTLRKCVDGRSAADICFLQQAGFGDERVQQANSGVEVFHGGSSAVESLFGAQVGRLHGSEIEAELLPTGDHMDFEQMSLNQILSRIRATSVESAASGATPEMFTPIRWGIYNPLIAYTGMFLTHAVLSAKLHHATASNAKLKDKLGLMDAAKTFVSDLQEYCPQIGPDGTLLHPGPSPEFCFFYLAIDPHFGPLLDDFKINEGFSWKDNNVIRDHVWVRGGGRKSWIQMVLAFNAGRWKWLHLKRRNTSAYMHEMLWYGPF
eukprot:TRINITY_DN23956_c0_g1_i1.p1 TRINITY_DN23956_c0_g1~~TRINITY_DN23956_c0_g1_i1.p1  ORF type:complete len:500 (-),score=63.53 TRINITY_DN23956_c0_g1_i1:15-1415(-)